MLHEEKSYIELPSNSAPIKAWTRGVEVAANALTQLQNTARLPFIHRHLAVMPDVHWGMGATIGSVIATVGAIVPAAVGVDIGCGMCAVQTTLRAEDLPDELRGVRTAIERAVPHGRSRGRAGGGKRDKGAWGEIPVRVANLWKEHLADGFERLCEKERGVRKSNHTNHLGTLGTGNHFIEVCLDEAERVWFLLHSGSRGVGNRIASIYITRAKQELEDVLGTLPDGNLAHLTEGTSSFDDYVEAVEWAQTFAALNRRIMLENVIAAVGSAQGIPRFETTARVVNCHHNYVAREHHFGADCLVTRKGAVRAELGDLGLIPGSMGAKSYVVRGKGNAQSFHSCSHGAGRVMSRTEAKRRFTVTDHKQATEGVECRKDADVIDETPMAYKDIDAVMRAQADLVDIVHTLRQVVCVKG